MLSELVLFSLGLFCENRGVVISNTKHIALTFAIYSSDSFISSLPRSAISI